MADDDRPGRGHALKPLSPFAAEWSVISALLDEVLGLPASEHAAWLEGLTGERAVHRQALRTLMAHRPGVETDDFLREVPQLDMAAAEPSGSGLAEGSHVGAYRLISEIGRGGMGTVWLAERTDGMMKRRVALKLPRIVWGDAFAERLAREREILATLEHEHIARLYDAGIDAQGRPFLAMEYVEGESIDAYCRTHAPSVRERIALLQQVMTAVAHAHARLVVHRDLKPGNILVNQDGQVKLLDFGIAKLMEGDRTRGTALTELAGRALTLDYASPEQIRGEPLGTASDIYSMAVVAFELLAGARPYRLKRASAAELEEAIASVEPPLASDCASDPRVARQLRGDLDAILNKALKKAAGERYSTMDAFAYDLQRHLDGAPVEARPDGLAYRAAKFVRRHRLQVAAGAVVAVALIAGTSVALWQAREARQAAATAQAVQGFIESVFNANSNGEADPAAARATTARELLDRGAERIDKELASAPEAQLRLYHLVADMYVGMALNERSVEMERRGLALATRLHGPQSEAALIAAANIALTLDDLGKTEEAVATLLQADAVASGRRNDRDQARMMIDHGLARVYQFSELPKALERARRAAAVARALGPSTDGIGALNILANTARNSGHLAEARQALVDEAAWADQLGAAGILPDLLGALGALQNESGQLEAAAATLARAIALAERSDNAQFLHKARYGLSRFLYDNRMLREALDSARAEADWARAPGHEQLGRDLPVLILFKQGQALTAYGDAARGLAVLDEARALMPPELEADRLGLLLAARAEALIALQRGPEAGADVERAVTMTASSGERNVETVRAIRRRYWVAVGKAEQALQDLAANPPKAGETNTPVKQLWRHAEEATLQLAAGRNAAARATAVDVLAMIERLPERRFFGVAEAQMTAVLGQALLHEDRAAEALPALQKALALHLAVFDPVHSPATAQVRLALAEAQRRAAR